MLDTGSGGTVLLADRLLETGIAPEPEDRLLRIRGVGGTEFVLRRRAERVELEDLVAEEFDVQVGGLSYGFLLDAIVGTDLLLATGAVVDFARLEIAAGAK